MAASMKNVRVKISFEQLQLSMTNPPRKSWYLIKPDIVNTVEDMCSDIIKQFLMDEVDRIEMYVDSCHVPEWQDVQIFRENDEICIFECSSERKKSKKKKKNKDSYEDEKQCNNIEVEDEQDQIKKKEVENELESAKRKALEALESEIGHSNDESNVEIKKQKLSEEMTHSAESMNEIESLETCTIRDKKKRKRKRNRKSKYDNVNTSMSFASDYHAVPFNSQKIYEKQNPTVNVENKGHIMFGSDDENDPSAGDCQVVIEESNTSADICAKVNGDDSFKHLQDETQYSNTQVYDESTNLNEDWKNNLLNLAEENKLLQNKNKKGRGKNAQATMLSPVPVFSRQNRMKHKKQANFSFSKAEQLSTVATNRSFILQNKSEGDNEKNDAVTDVKEKTEIKESDPVPKDSEEKAGKKDVVNDFSDLPPLHQAPNHGAIIAFKIIQMGENYAPQVSDYKVAKVLSYNSQSQMLQVEIIHETPAKSKPGRFDIEEHKTQADKIMDIDWTALIDPKLVSN